MVNVLSTGFLPATVNVPLYGAPFRNVPEKLPRTLPLLVFTNKSSEPDNGVNVTSPVIALPSFALPINCVVVNPNCCALSNVISITLSSATAIPR